MKRPSTQKLVTKFFGPKSTIQQTAEKYQKDRGPNAGLMSVYTRKEENTTTNMNPPSIDISYDCIHQIMKVLLSSLYCHHNTSFE
jgi:hypothetical protein